MFTKSVYAIISKFSNSIPQLHQRQIGSVVFVLVMTMTHPALAFAWSSTSNSAGTSLDLNSSDYDANSTAIIVGSKLKF
jgi:hypothetical protein